MTDILKYIAWLLVMVGIFLVMLGLYDTRASAIASLGMTITTLMGYYWRN